MRVALPGRADGSRRIFRCLMICLWGIATPAFTREEGPETAREIVAAAAVLTDADEQK